MPYTWITLTQMMALLAARLNDLSNVFYSAGHLRSICKESLRAWQSMSTVHRGRFAPALTSGQAFYDLATLTGSLVSRTLTDRDLVNDLQYALMENVNDFSSSSTWAGTGMFTMADLVNALQRRRDQFLLETACVLTHAETAVGAPVSGRVALTDNTIDVRRAAWKDAATLVYTTLWRSDERQLNSLSPGWAATPGPPAQFSTIVVPPVTLQLAPPPQAVGSVSLVTVNAGTTLDVTTGVALGVPDDFCWALKFGALADLLSKDGEARDPARAAHCENRYQQGVQLARLYQSVLTAEVNGAQTPIVPLQALDSMQPGWQTLATGSGTPTVVALAGLNLIAVSPIPNALTSLTIDCVRNAPIPATDSAFVELAHEHLEPVLDYAIYLARFKEAGVEFEMTIPLAGNLVRLAEDHNARLRAQAQQEKALAENAQWEFRRRNMRIEDTNAS